MYKLKGYKLLEPVSSKTLKRRALSYRNNILKIDRGLETIESKFDPEPNFPLVPQLDPQLIEEVVHPVLQSSNKFDDDFLDSNPYFVEDDSDVCTDSDDDEVSLNSISKDIQIWVTTIALDALLLILRKYGHRTLPKSYKTLL